MILLSTVLSYIIDSAKEKRETLYLKVFEVVVTKECLWLKIQNLGADNFLIHPTCVVVIILIEIDYNQEPCLKKFKSKD